MLTPDIHPEDNVTDRPQQPDRQRFVLELESIEDPAFPIIGYHTSGDRRLKLTIKVLLRIYSLRFRSVRLATLSA